MVQALLKRTFLGKQQPQGMLVPLLLLRPLGCVEVCQLRTLELNIILTNKEKIPKTQNLQNKSCFRVYRTCSYFFYWTYFREDVCKSLRVKIGWIQLSLRLRSRPARRLGGFGVWVVHPRVKEIGKKSHSEWDFPS